MNLNDTKTHNRRCDSNLQFRGSSRLFTHSGKTAGERSLGTIHKICQRLHTTVVWKVTNDFPRVNQLFLNFTLHTLIVC